MDERPNPESPGCGGEVCFFAVAIVVSGAGNAVDITAQEANVENDVDDFQ